LKEDKMKGKDEEERKKMGVLQVNNKKSNMVDLKKGNYNTT
jgi:hypothetical protein